MSERVYVQEEFELGDIVEFDAPTGGRLTGEVVRVYNTRFNYHVQVENERYSVSLEDNMKKVGTT